MQLLTLAVEFHVDLSPPVFVYANIQSTAL